MGEDGTTPAGQTSHPREAGGTVRLRYSSERRVISAVMYTTSNDGKYLFIDLILGQVKHRGKSSGGGGKNAKTNTSLIEFHIFNYDKLL